MNEKLYALFHPRPDPLKISSWFCRFHPQNFLAFVYNSGNGHSICEQCMNLFIRAGRQASEHKTNSRSVGRRHWSK